MQTSSLTSLVSLLILILIAVANSSVTVKKTSDELPHPSAMELELVLPDSNKKLLVPLTRITAFENIPMTLLENGHSRRFSSRQVRHPSHSHYRDLDSGSVISVRSVNGSRFLSGHVMHKGISYSLEPIGESEHRIVKSERSSSEASLKRVISKKLRTLVSRRKRQSNNSSTTYVIELHLLLDHTVWQTMKEMYRNEGKILTELNSYYTHILNGIDTVFRNIKSISISVQCIGMTLAKTRSDSKWLADATSFDAADILAAISNYGFGQSPDHFMAFTRNDITVKGTDASGVSYPSGACKDRRVSLIEDHGLHSWATAAHELGHNLGAEHDGEGNTCLESDKYALTPLAGYYNLSDVKNSYRFSACSESYISKYIDGLGPSNCLITSDGDRVMELMTSQPIGALVTLDEVCRLALLNRAKFHVTLETAQNPESICASIACSTPVDGVKRIPEIRAPVGTSCGNRRICNWNGECALDASAPEADDTCFWANIWSPHRCFMIKRKILKRKAICTKEAVAMCCKTLKRLLMCAGVG